MLTESINYKFSSFIDDTDGVFEMLSPGFIQCFHTDAASLVRGMDKGIFTSIYGSMPTPVYPETENVGGLCILEFDLPF